MLDRMYTDFMQAWNECPGELTTQLLSCFSFGISCMLWFESATLHMAERDSSHAGEDGEKPHVPDFPRENFYLFFCVVLPFILKHYGRYDEVCIDAGSFGSMSKLLNASAAFFSFLGVVFQTFLMFGEGAILFSGVTAGILAVLVLVWKVHGVTKP